MTLTFDLWPWKPLQQCQLVLWIFVPSFIEICPLNTYRDIASCKMSVNGRTDDGVRPRHTTRQCRRTKTSKCRSTMSGRVSRVPTLSADNVGHHFDDRQCRPIMSTDNVSTPDTARGCRPTTMSGRVSGVPTLSADNDYLWEVFF